MQFIFINWKNNFRTIREQSKWWEFILITQEENNNPGAFLEIEGVQ